MARELSEKSSMKQWLEHPTGGAILREMLARAGQDERALRPVRLFSLQRVASMSGGQLTPEMIADMVARANHGQAPEGAPAAAQAAPAESPTAGEEAPEPEPWVERIAPGRFDGKTVVVTGAGSGIGRATAARIAREGGRVVAVDVVPAGLATLAGELPDVVTVQADITDPAGIEAITAAAGRVDALANVAGVMDDMTPLHEVTDAMWDRVMTINVTGTFRLTRAVLPLMLAAGGGSIVNVASEAALRGSAAGLSYTTSKHAVVGMTKSTAFMYAEHGIRVNAVAPGPVATGIGGTFASELGATRLQPQLALIPPIAEPEQLAASISWLLSDDATNVTGVVLASDGGWSAA